VVRFIDVKNVDIFQKCLFRPKDNDFLFRAALWKNSILSFKASTPSSFGDAAEWQQHQRADRKLPFS